MTSVKDFRVEEPATPEALGRGSFRFTDDYSVFDWGKMPDEIPDKGASLCTMGAFNFELLEAAGIPTHYRGVVIDGEPLDVDTALDHGVAPREMAIDLAQVPDLPFDEREGYDYDAYHEAAGSNYVVPLEVVFRNRVGAGSSLRSRTEPGEHGLDHGAWPEGAVDLPEAVVEFSTKYEEQDRYLDPAEADRIAGAAELAELEALAREVNRVVTERAAETGFVHQDGKIECVYHDGDLLVADVVGTFDENRFSYDGQQVSKEVLRQYHKRTQPGWVEAVGAAKAEADRRGVADWKGLCDRAPDPLENHVLGVARDLYCAGTNAYVGREVFDAPTIDEAVASVRDL
ncbi:phosphoribosylaminoimidazolesuccinocarboxamide synthase [Salinirussus salinus]|uniref:phosphoribosylaminoimidazolesuccinocarboxamide synthase n=1 Tax=Salinirussus salinus TaxID=1198300 RepID=UPI001357CB80|nr:phosphoribosylaminoimidazolesuccinocarboxamide synthase [Salinirussus salinus]